MPLISNQSSYVPSIVSYVSPIFDTNILKNSKSRAELDQHILSQTQGESILLREVYDVSSLMYITNVIYSSSPELVLVTKDGLKVQIFDFTSEPVIRAPEIITSFSVLNKETPTKKSTSDVAINIQTIWDSEKSEDTPQKLYTCLQNIIKQSPETNKTTLIGEGPVVLFLLAEHILATRTKELWYQRDLDSKPLRIY